MVTSILVRPQHTTPERLQGIPCPVCGLLIRRLTPQQAAKHGLSVEDMATAHPQFGVSRLVKGCASLERRRPPREGGGRMFDGCGGRI